jgi:hypothetical protein
VVSLRWITDRAAPKQAEPERPRFKLAS